MQEVEHGGLESSGTQWFLVRVFMYLFFIYLGLGGQRVSICLERMTIPPWNSSLNGMFFAALRTLNILYVWSHELGLLQKNVPCKIV